MPAPQTQCPFCRNLVQPTITQVGQLQCPLCFNTGRVSANPSSPWTGHPSAAPDQSTFNPPKKGWGAGKIALVVIAVIVGLGAISAIVNPEPKDSQASGIGANTTPNTGKMWQTDFLKVTILEHSVVSGNISLKIRLENRLVQGCALVVLESLTTQSGTAYPGDSSDDLCPGSPKEATFQFAAPGSNPQAKWMGLKVDYVNYDDGVTRPMLMDLSSQNYP